MENDSFNQNNINNNTNMSQSNIDYEALTAELHSYYVKYRSSNNKKEMIKGIMQNTVYIFYLLRTSVSYLISSSQIIIMKNLCTS